MTVTSPKSFGELVGFAPSAGTPAEVHGTTVLAMRFDRGVLIVADRRATMGNLIMYEHAEKILPLDDCTVVAVSGAYARSLEISRYLRHAFKYYERLNLVEISTEGKLMEISRALQGNLPAAQEGSGLFLPIAAAYDHKNDRFGVYFFDAAGARFQSQDYACAGSGSERIRGLFEYLIRTKGPWATRRFESVLDEALTMLDIAADLDSATGGFRKILPSVFILTSKGVQEMSDDDLREAVERILK
ncbi:MAG: proteasome subunit alpha [Armatimonadetes bacterium]|nr:proteasome subunit alpha [Armatimonadota bacterium]